MLGDPLLRARFAAGSRSLLYRAEVALAIGVKCCGDGLWRSTLSGSGAIAVVIVKRKIEQDYRFEVGLSCFQYIR